jgi:hypothetical protein
VTEKVAPSIEFTHFHGLNGDFDGVLDMDKFNIFCSFMIVILLNTHESA